MYHLDEISVFRERNREKAFTVNLSEVKLVDKIHREKPRKRFGGNSEPLILVRKIYKGYALVTGYRDYWRAVQSGQETIKAVRVYAKNRQDFISSFKRRIAVEDIIIPDKFLECPPRINKIKNAERYYRRNGVFDKPIILGKGNILKDGYARYIAAINLGLNEVPYVR